MLAAGCWLLEEGSWVISRLLNILERVLRLLFVVGRLAWQGRKWPHLLTSAQNLRLRPKQHLLDPQGSAAELQQLLQLVGFHLGLLPQRLRQQRVLQHQPPASLNLERLIQSPLGGGVRKKK